MRMIIIDNQHYQMCVLDNISVHFIRIHIVDRPLHRLRTVRPKQLQAGTVVSRGTAGLSTVYD